MRQHVGIVFILLAFMGHLGADAQRVYYDEQLVNWQDRLPPPGPDLMHTVVMVGDVKYPASDSTLVRLLGNVLETIEGQNGSVILLGDLAYPRGLPEETDPGYREARDDLEALLSVLEPFDGNIIFLPGNHDWDKGGKNGWDNVKNESSFVTGLLDRDNVYFPGAGCPGPFEIPLSDDITAIVFDSQWWFQKFQKPGPDEGCEFEDEAGLFVQIEDIIRRNKDKKIIFATHHPLFSVGNHGGFFPASRLLFPLLDINKSLFIPLPGFIYTWYRKYLGSIQDLAHPEYKILKNTLKEVFRQYPNII